MSYIGASPESEALKRVAIALEGAGDQAASAANRANAAVLAAKRSAL